VVVGHTPDMADRVGVTQTLDPNRPGGRRVPRFLFADSGYCGGGEARMVQVTLSADGKSSHIAYVDPEKNSDVQDGAMPGQSVLNRRYNLDKTFNENAAAAAPEPPAAPEGGAEAEPPAAEPAEGEAPTAEEAAAVAAAADMAETGLFDPKYLLELISTGIMRPKPGEREGERANWQIQGEVLATILKGSSDPRQKAVGVMLTISQRTRNIEELEATIASLEGSNHPRLSQFKTELQVQRDCRVQDQRELDDLKTAGHDPDAIMQQFNDQVKQLAGADTMDPNDPVSVLSSVAQRLLDPKQADRRRKNIGQVIDILAPEMADADKAEMTEKINSALRTQLKEHYGDVAKFAIHKTKDAAIGAAGIFALLFVLQMYRGIKANSPQQGMGG